MTKAVACTQSCCFYSACVLVYVREMSVFYIELRLLPRLDVTENDRANYNQVRGSDDRAASFSSRMGYGVTLGRSMSTILSICRGSKNLTFGAFTLGFWV